MHTAKNDRAVTEDLHAFFLFASVVTLKVSPLFIALRQIATIFRRVYFIESENDAFSSCIQRQADKTQAQLCIVEVADEVPHQTSAKLLEESFKHCTGVLLDTCRS